MCEKINFVSNSIIKSDIDDNSLDNFSELKYLYLDKNNISDISVLETFDFNKLYNLNLSNNKISNINIFENKNFSKNLKIYLLRNPINNKNISEKFLNIIKEHINMNSAPSPPYY